MKLKYTLKPNDKIASLSFAILLFSLLLVCLVACNKQTAPTQSSQPHYEIFLTLDTNNDKLTCRQDVLCQVPSKDAVDKLVFHIYANAFGTIDILSAQIDGLNVDCAIYGTDNTLLSLPYTKQDNNQVVVSFDYEVQLKTSNTRLCRTANGNYNLSHFYPVLAVYSNGWDESTFSQIGDPFFTEISSFLLSASYPQGYTLASSGVMLESSQDTLKHCTVQANDVRDFGLSIGKYQTTSTALTLDTHEVQINYFYNDDSAPNLTLERASESLRTFSSAFGEYPYTTLAVVQNDLNAGGMEYGGYVLVAPNGIRQTYLDVITHEIAHQWWYNLVGNNQLVDAWLDEGLAEFCTSYFHLLNGDGATHLATQQSIEKSYREFDKLRHSVGFNGKMSRPLTSYLTDGEYVAVVYLKGSLLFETLRKLAGDDKFCQCLKDYCTSNYMGISSKESLVASFEKHGLFVQGIVDSFVNDTLVFCS